MSAVDRNRTAPPALAERSRVAPGAPQRGHARVHVELTELEVRSIVRATTLVADLLRPELFRLGDGSVAQSPLVTGYQTLVAACERAGVDLGLGAASPGRGTSAP